MIYIPMIILHRLSSQVWVDSHTWIYIRKRYDNSDPEPGGFMALPE